MAIREAKNNNNTTYT